MKKGKNSHVKSVTRGFVTQQNSESTFALYIVVIDTDAMIVTENIKQRRLYSSTSEHMRKISNTFVSNVEKGLWIDTIWMDMSIQYTPKQNHTNAKNVWLDLLGLLTVKDMKRCVRPRLKHLEL